MGELDAIDALNQASARGTARPPEHTYPPPTKSSPRLRDKRPAPGVASFTGEGTAEDFGLDRKALSTALRFARFGARSYLKILSGDQAEQVTKAPASREREPRHRVQGELARCPNRQCRGRGGQGTRNPHRRKATKSLLSPPPWKNQAASCFGENGGLIQERNDGGIPLASRQQP